MIKVGETFDQDGREYVATHGTDPRHKCKGCSFEASFIGCAKAPRCTSIDDRFHFIIFIEVKK